MAFGKAALVFAAAAGGCRSGPAHARGDLPAERVPRQAQGFGGWASRAGIIEPSAETAPALTRAVSTLERESRERPQAPRPDLPVVTTIEGAAERIRTGVSMACPPSLRTEWDGWFLFSGGTRAAPVRDFSTGLGIRKGTDAIYSW